MMTPELQAQIELEMIYEPYSSLTSCLEPLLVGNDDERGCRRNKKHTGYHASGFGTGFVYWERVEDVERSSA